MEMTWARRPGRRRARAALLGATVVAILLGLAPAGSAAPTLVSQTPDATASVDGRVQAIARIGGWLYVGGSFTAVSGKPRAGLARVNVASGAVDPSRRRATPSASTTWTSCSRPARWSTSSRTAATWSPPTVIAG